ncbi:MAG: VOC family protein [Bacteroidetes bacterium]|nr:VOC family protein [Bacteroidota bacterium]
MEKKNPQNEVGDQSTSEIKAAFLPTLSVRNGAAAVEFYKKAFDAEVAFCLADPDGGVVAELSIRGVRFIVADESPEHENFSPETLGGSTIRMGLVVPDPDAMAKQAIASGAEEIYPVADQDYGYRLGRVKDPFGHHWEICRKL